MANQSKRQRNLTTTPPSLDNDPVWEASERLKDQRQAEAQGGVKDKSEKKTAYKDVPEFQEYVAKNLWTNRRNNGFDWRCDVFAFIRKVYAPWLGQGLVQSDIKACDPKLYAQLHKQLTAMTPGEKTAILTSLKLPTESEARLEALEDPEQREALLEARRLAKEAMRLVRAI